MGGWSSGVALGPAKRAVVECGNELMSTPGAFGGRQCFKRDDALNFFQRGDLQVRFLQRVLL
jgi:hypothetical protein